MAWARKYDYDLLALQVDQLLTAGPLTIEQIADELGVPKRVARQAVHHHRHHLSDQQRALVTEPFGSRSAIYVLTDEPTRIRFWAKRRIDDTYTRLRTISKETSVAVKLTDGRTVEGQRARMLDKAVRRLMEDIDDLSPAFEQGRLAG